MDSRTFDWVVVGGGAAGAIVAARLSEETRETVALLEWGRSDEHEPRARLIRNWFDMLESEYDLDYRSVPQERGNSNIQQSRAKILGGCSSHNGMIAFKPLPGDLREWVDAGATGWDYEIFGPYFDRVAGTAHIQPVAEEHRNPYLKDVITAASHALGVPVREQWNDSATPDGAGFLELGYDPASGERSSSSLAYLHGGAAERPNLDILTEHRATRILFDSARRATGVSVLRADGSSAQLHARREVIVCAGAIDTPKLLWLSGVGPGGALRDLGIDVVCDLPGVGENLSDHPEGLLVFEAARDVSPVTVTAWDMAICARTSDDPDLPEVLMHVPLDTYAIHSERIGYPTPKRSLSITPNVAKPKSRGSVYLTSPDIDVPPAIDYRYFTDPDGYDEHTLLAGMRMARSIAQTQPMAGWIAAESFPGSQVQGDAELSELARTTNHTVYHVSCTCKMGRESDDMAVLDPHLRVRGVQGLRVVDASSFPTLTARNPVVTVMMLAERAADLIRQAHQ